MTTQDEQRMSDLVELARVTYADATGPVKPLFYDNEPVVEIWDGNCARVLSREHVLADRERFDATAEAMHRTVDAMRTDRADIARRANVRS